ncbi:hypothetical protein VNO77_06725 [Canavalia gladiata]|uniref:Uncharacterized protein n=1 Tax=Canavalia gladiata TaxID=3824 RepID=A0AAN9MCL5_CANGL
MHKGEEVDRRKSCRPGLTDLRTLIVHLEEETCYWLSLPIFPIHLAVTTTALTSIHVSSFSPFTLHMSSYLPHPKIHTVLNLETREI